jgi:threonine dehydrogenase-like Zn-dependent dehydrogenase
MREIGFRPDSPGGMGEYMVVEEQYVHAVPDDWSFEDAAWVETFSIGYFAIWGNNGFIDASDTALIFGAGPVGLSAAMVAKTSGARSFMVDPIESRRARSLQYGADEVIDPSDGKLEERIMDLTGGQGASVCVEASGTDQALAALFDVSGHSARIRLVGHSIGRKVPVEIGKTIWKTLSITGSGGTKNFGQRTIRFMSAMKDNYDFAGLNTHHFPFSDLHKAFDVAIHNKEEALKVMLTY